jgi:nucleotide-binding universal stress UspA family protein
MGTILCATRGGEASIQTQDAAIRLAASGGDDIVFFFVVDVEFMAYAQYTLRSDVVHEQLQEMAEFLMAIAVERAGKKNVSARALIRHGAFVEELVGAANEVSATLVVLGRPDDDKAAFKLAHLQEVAAQLAKQTGIPCVILPAPLDSASEA